MQDNPQTPTDALKSEINSAMNSELIQQKFGSYGVDVWAHDSHQRLSSLYSVHERTKVTRTIALVTFNQAGVERFNDEHRDVVGGASIGATFAHAGWLIRKPLRAVYQLPARELYAPLYQAMNLDQSQTLSMHIYDFVVAAQDESGRGTTYATIVEIHSPGYLTSEEVDNIAANVSPARTPERQPTLDKIELLLQQRLKAIRAA